MEPRVDGVAGSDGVPSRGSIFRSLADCYPRAPSIQIVPTLGSKVCK